MSSRLLGGARPLPWARLPAGATMETREGRLEGLECEASSAHGRVEEWGVREASREAGLQFSKPDNTHASLSGGGCGADCGSDMQEEG